MKTMISSKNNKYGHGNIYYKIVDGIWIPIQVSEYNRLKNKGTKEIPFS